MSEIPNPRLCFAHRSGLIVISYSQYYDDAHIDMLFSSLNSKEVYYTDTLLIDDTMKVEMVFPHGKYVAPADFWGPP